MKRPDIKFPVKIPSFDKMKFDKRKTLSFVSYAFGMSEKLAPFAALEVGTHFLKLVEVMVEDGKRNILGYWMKEVPFVQGASVAQRQKDLMRLVKDFLKESPLTAPKFHLGFSV